MTDQAGATPSDEKPITTLDRANFGVKLLESVLTEYTKGLKLHFGLQTGALVLLLKVLTDVHAPFIVRTALVISILFFGTAAITCLRLLEGVAGVRGKMLRAWADERANWAATFRTQMNQWESETKTAGKLMEWFLRLAIIFAVLFVVGVLIASQSACDLVGTV